MIRAVRLNLKFASQKKLTAVSAVLERYRAVVNAYIKHIWIHGGTLDKVTQEAVPTGHLSARYRSHALKQALAVVSATKASSRATDKKASMPRFKGSMTISKQLAVVSPSKNCRAFDLCLRISTLRPGNRITVPIKKTRMYNKWANFPGAVLKGGCAIGDRGKLVVWFDIPDLMVRSKGSAIGIDIGVNKLLACSNQERIGTGIKAVMAKIRRCKNKSKGKRRAVEHRRHYIGECVRKLPWQDLRIVAVEDLKDIKRGKQKNRGKQFRKAIAPWTAAYVLARIEAIARENRVLCVKVNPAHTSQTCPKCNHRAKSNRSNEKFMCGGCGYASDADFAGSVNILNRALGSISSPRRANAA